MGNKDALQKVWGPGLYCIAGVLDTDAQRGIWCFSERHRYHVQEKSKRGTFL